jgi:hypothetical protein
MRERLINRRRQGDLGEASAIEWLTSKGMLVWFPLGHSPDIDLVAQTDDQLLRIQVKSCVAVTTTPDGHLRWTVKLATLGGNQSWGGTTKRLDPAKVDHLFALTGHGRRWFIPSSCLEARNAVTLGGRKYSEFEIEPGVPIEPLVYGESKALSTIHPLPGEYPSGQRMAPVKRPAMPSQVRILPPPSAGSGRPASERKLGRSGQAIVRGKRLMTIPARPYLEAGLEVGDRVRFRADGLGRVILERIEAPSS